MKTIVKSFGQLTTDDLFAIYKLRVSVFVVEQSCPYQEVDDLDKIATHIWLEEGGNILAYLRILPPGAVHGTVTIGRVIAAKRRQGLGTAVMRAAIEQIRGQWKTDRITVEAQVYAKPFYEKLGFRSVSAEFLEDGIPHIRMER